MKKIRKKLSLSHGRERMLEEIRNNDHSRLTTIREYPTYIDHQPAAPKSSNFLESLDIIKSTFEPESSISSTDEWEPLSEPKSGSDSDSHYAFLPSPPPPPQWGHSKPEKQGPPRLRPLPPIPPPPNATFFPPSPLPSARSPLPPHLRGLKFPPPPLPRNCHPVVPPATRKYNADRQGVIQKVSDISMTNSTFRADIIKAPHVKVETFVCCSIHIGESECDCKKSLKKKSKMQNLVKIVRGTSFVLGTYILYHLHDIFDSD